MYIVNTFWKIFYSNDNNLYNLNNYAIITFIYNSLVGPIEASAIHIWIELNFFICCTSMLYTKVFYIKSK